MARICRDLVVSPRNVIEMTTSTLASFLLPEGFARPAVAAVLREGSLVAEAGRYALRSAGQHRERRSAPYTSRQPVREADPVLLVPGFMAGDSSLAFMSRALRGQGYRTLLLTNNIREYSGQWRAKLPVDELFEFVIDSSEVGMRKPEPEIFRHTLDLLGCAAEEAVFVDDLPVSAAGKVLKRELRQRYRGARTPS